MEYGMDMYTAEEEQRLLLLFMYLMYVFISTNSNPVFRNPHHLVDIDFSSFHGGNKDGKYAKSSEKVRSE